MDEEAPSPSSTGRREVADAFRLPSSPQAPASAALTWEAQCSVQAARSSLVSLKCTPFLSLPDASAIVQFPSGCLQSCKKFQLCPV